MKTATKTKFKQTEIGPIPEDWDISDLGEVAEIIGGGTPSTSMKEYWDPPEIEWVTARDISISQTAKIQRTEKRISKLGLENSSAKLLLPLTTVIIARGATMGKCRMLSREMAMNQTCYGIVAKEKVTAVYLYYQLSNLYKQFRASAHGSVFDTVIGSGLQSMVMTLPPIEEQRHIARILSDLDSKIELNQQMNKTLEKIGRAIFKHWFVDFEFPNEEGKPYRSSGGEMVYNEELGKEIPKSWKVGKISEICSTQYGYTASASDDPVGPKFLRVTDMNKDPWIDWSKVPHCKIDGQSLRRYKLSIGDILVSRMADPGKAAIVEENINAVFASYLIRLRTESLAWSYYLFYFLRSQMYQNYVESAKSGSVQSSMNAKVITSADVFLPSQNAIKEFLAAVTPLRNRIVVNLQESNALSLIRDSLLPKLMSGKIRVPVEVR